MGQDSHQEGHAGLTFCGIAALALMGTLETALSAQQVTLRADNPSTKLGYL